MNTNPDRLVSIVNQLTTRLRTLTAEADTIEAERKKLVDILVDSHEYSSWEIYELLEPGVEQQGVSKTLNR